MDSHDNPLLRFGGLMLSLLLSYIIFRFSRPPSRVKEAVP